MMIKGSTGFGQQKYETRGSGTTCRSESTQPEHSGDLQNSGSSFWDIRYIGGNRHSYTDGDGSGGDNLESRTRLPEGIPEASAPTSLWCLC